MGQVLMLGTVRAVIGVIVLGLVAAAIGQTGIPGGEQAAMGDGPGASSTG